MLTDDILEKILAGIPRLKIAVVGDLFLDRYLDLDATLTEPSIETGLDAYQVARVRSVPGAAGTVINNLAALGVGTVIPVAVIGDDGEGYELRQALDRLGVVSPSHLITRADRRTPTYTKPMFCQPGEPPRELNRLDIKNRTPLPHDAAAAVCDAVTAIWPAVDAVLVLDQVSEAECGVITGSIRHRIAELAAADPSKFVLADSRERIGNFANVALKPNERECRLAVGDQASMSGVALLLARRCARPVFLTRGETGIIVAEPAAMTLVEVPAYPVRGPIDTVGAGDSTSAAIACAVAAGASLVEAAAFGNIVASITIQQIGTTGTATPAQVRERWNEIKSSIT